MSCASSPLRRRHVEPEAGPAAGRQHLGCLLSYSAAGMSSIAITLVIVHTTATMPV